MSNRGSIGGEGRSPRNVPLHKQTPEQQQKTLRGKLAEGSKSSKRLHQARSGVKEDSAPPITKRDLREQSVRDSKEKKAQERLKKAKKDFKACNEAYEKAFDSFEYQMDLLEQLKSQSGITKDSIRQQKENLNSELEKSAKTLEEAEIELEKAEAALEALNQGIAVSDKAIKKLEETGPTAQTAVQLGDAVDNYKQAVVDLIRSKNADQTDYKFAQINLDQRMEDVEEALQIASAEMGGIKKIDSQIQSIEDQYKKVREARAQSTKKDTSQFDRQLAMLAGQHKSLENLKAVLKDADRTLATKQSDAWEKSIMKEGFMSPYFDDIRAITSTLENEIKLDMKPTMLGISGSLDHCTEQLKHIDKLLAVEKGLTEFKKKNDEILDKLAAMRRSWAFTICTIGLGNLVVMLAQIHYNRQGKTAEEYRHKANTALGKMLGFSDAEIANLNIIPKKTEVLLSSADSDTDSVSQPSQLAIADLTTQVENAKIEWMNSRKAADDARIFLEGVKDGKHTATSTEFEQARANLQNNVDKYRTYLEAKLELIKMKKAQQIDLSLDELIVQLYDSSFSKSLWENLLSNPLNQSKIAAQIAALNSLLTMNPKYANDPNLKFLLDSISKFDHDLQNSDWSMQLQSMRLFLFYIQDDIDLGISYDAVLGNAVKRLAQTLDRMLIVESSENQNKATPTTTTTTTTTTTVPAQATTVPQSTSNKSGIPLIDEYEDYMNNVVKEPLINQVQSFQESLQKIQTELNTNKSLTPNHRNQLEEIFKAIDARCTLIISIMNNKTVQEVLDAQGASIRDIATTMATMTLEEFKKLVETQQIISKWINEQKPKHQLQLKTQLVAQIQTIFDAYESSKKNFGQWALDLVFLKTMLSKSIPREKTAASATIGVTPTTTTTSTISGTSPHSKQWLENDLRTNQTNLAAVIAKIDLEKQKGIDTTEDINYLQLAFEKAELERAIALDNWDLEKLNGEQSPEALELKKIHDKAVAWENFERTTLRLVEAETELEALRQSPTQVLQADIEAAEQELEQNRLNLGQALQEWDHLNEEEVLRVVSPTTVPISTIGGMPTVPATVDEVFQGSIFEILENQTAFLDNNSSLTEEDIDGLLDYNINLAKLILDETEKEIKLNPTNRLNLAESAIDILTKQQGQVARIANFIVIGSRKVGTNSQVTRLEELNKIIVSNLTIARNIT